MANFFVLGCISGFLAGASGVLVKNKRYGPAVTSGLGSVIFAIMMAASYLKQ